jgi:uncharacterized membrane protein
VVKIIVYTVVTFVATAMLAVETPATGGYFNLGEAAIYAIAVVEAPLVTAIAAGLGPALADLALGYWYFSPATFAIKFTEGYVVSKLSHRLRSGKALSQARLLTIVAGLGLAGVVAYNAFGGSGEEKVGLELELGHVNIAGVKLPLPTVTADLPSWLWLLIAALILALAVGVAVAASRRPYLLAMTAGGLIMVTGYFLYEFFVSNPLILHRAAWAAVTEVPVNVGQFTAGILLAYPIVSFVERATGRRQA